jgi:hypothetical protein
MRGLSVIDPACACSCHAHLTPKAVDRQLEQLLKLLEPPPLEETKDRTTAFERASIAFDLGEL